MRSKFLSLESDVFLRYREGEEELPALWCIHGYGASGRSFLEAFDAPELEAYSLYVPDFPGFGKSPESATPQGIPEAAGLLATLIDTLSATEPVVLVGHSAGGLIGTRVAFSLERVQGFVNIEGNLTDADNFISGKVAVAEDVEAWRRDFLEELHGPVETDEALRRYRADLITAGPRTLRAWAVSVVNETGVTRAGERFMQVPCPRLYAYGKKSIPERTLAFLLEHRIPHLEFAESGHSPMIDEAQIFYAAIASFLSDQTAR
jgi:pimeloyl-ACP methyl ester carboxylesterase